ncbi:MAG: metabolite traffic protein EboE [Verrucomicrobiaceae bacterium]|nr:metabolite traffic protein EboE [Verrucomicrobiaceae bacterium]
MELNDNLHLAYCTNIHRGEGWRETFANLEKYVLGVRDEVAVGRSYAIGLRLGAGAAEELCDPSQDNLGDFRRWLDANNCYVFTINGFPYGNFHGERVKEQVYIPDWTSRDRLEYTKRLFDIIAELVPDGVSGSVSTLPGSFKEFINDDEEQGSVIIDNLAECAEHILHLVESTGKDLHLGLEPEPLGWFETSGETVAFFKRFREQKGGRFDRVLGVNYDTCHLAIEFEEPKDAISNLLDAGIRISKLHLSSALKLEPNPASLRALENFQEDVYLHQVVTRDGDGNIIRYRDLPDALKEQGEKTAGNGEQWRVHFHIPLYSEPAGGLADTRDHIDGVLDMLREDASICSHLEMETYTWEVLPEELQCGDVVEQLRREYEWILKRLSERGLA